MTIDEGHYYNYLLFVVITYGKVCIYGSGKPGKLENCFSLTLWPACVLVSCC